VAVAGLFAGCGAERPVLAPPDPKLRGTTSTLAPAVAPASKRSTTTTTAPGHRLLRAGPSTMEGLIATPIGDPMVHRSPKRSSALIPIVRVNKLGVTTVFAVIGDDSTPWIEVLLPTRPNGAIGWVQRSKVQLTTTDVRLFVNLGRRRLTVKRANHTLMHFRIAIGTVANPTPTGITYIAELLDTGMPNGPWGPYEFGLALHSNTLSEFGGGDGQVGIHGTNMPNLVGQRVSHGCVRLTNQDVRRLVNLKLALGTPVFIS
jgi:lipoprotein-anchoring transpeptidase ErfK/SrfK